MRQVLRSIYLWTAIAFATALMYVSALPVFIVTAPFDRKRSFGHWWAQRWGRLILKLNNRWSSGVIGQERIPRDRPLVVVANHQGMGDIMMAFCLDLHFKWISKASNFYVPFMGWFMFHAGYIPVVRGRKDSVEKCMARARQWLTDGVSVLFFPEGTRSQDGVVKPFKNGAFKLALETGCDILPLGISGTVDALPKHTWKFSDDHTTMRILVGQPIPTRGLDEDDLDALNARVREAVIALKAELDGQPADRSEPLRAVG
jgi:1-acyl-sn-glycerol-3-phosphate acyltransferase